MTTYFDIQRAVDRSYLDPSALDHPDLRRIAAETEADVIAFYTKSLADMPFVSFGALTIRPAGGTRLPSYTAVGDTLGVFLEYYESDPADVDVGDAAAAAFLVAFRRTIAAVITWRLLTAKVNTLALTEGRKTMGLLVKSAVQMEPFPPNWQRWLMPYITVPALTVI